MDTMLIANECLNGRLRYGNLDILCTLDIKKVYDHVYPMKAHDRANYSELGVPVLLMKDVWIWEMVFLVLHLGE